MSADIHLCRADEVDVLAQFLREHWAADHVLALCRPLLDWQHRDGDRYNFVLARRKGDGAVLGVLGFIPTRHYDPQLASRNTVWLALWKVRSDAGIAGLGLLMLQFLRRQEPHQAIAVSGVGNPAHFAMYRALGFTTGELSQYFLRNRKIGSHHLASLREGTWPETLPRGGATLERVSAGNFAVETRELEWKSLPDCLPVKTARYFQRRFFAHPVYEYLVFLIRHDGRARGLVAARIATHEGHRALRIVDLLGEPALLGDLGAAFHHLLEQNQAEYADLWCHGVDEEALRRTGFHKVDPDGPVIVPNFFEPFLARNGRIRFAFKADGGERFLVFRADGDQDRPNRVS